MASDERLLFQVVCTRADPTAAQLKLRLWPGLAVPDGVRVEGHVAGPFCAYARTLSLKMPLVPLAVGGEWLAEAHLPEPCFWTPEMPFLYEVQFGYEVPLGDPGAKPAAGTERRLFGILPLSTRGKQLRLWGQNWVLRGARRDAVTPVDLERWHEEGAAMLVASPSDALCAAASRAGVLLVAEVDGSAPALERDLCRLATCPAVGIIAVQIQRELAMPPATLRAVAPGKLLALWLDLDEGPQRHLLALSPWASLVMVRGSSPRAIRTLAGQCPLPLIAVQAAPQPLSLAAARAGCDLLQRDLASADYFAGYCVG